MDGTFGFLTIWGDNKVDVVSTAKVDVVSTAMAIEVSHSRENEYVAEITTLLNKLGHSETYSFSLE
jgi:hypothetical protein